MHFVQPSLFHNLHRLFVTSFLLTYLGCGDSALRLSDAELQVREQAIAMINSLQGEYRVDKKHADEPLVRVHLANTAVTNDDLQKLIGMARLENLNLQGTSISDEGLAHLKDIKSLVELNVANTQVTDAGLVHLMGLSNLKGLYVRYTSITENGINGLKQAIPEINVITGGFGS